MAKVELSPEVKQQIAEVGYAISGSIGGIPRQRYWLPDGREVLAIPSLHTFQVNGNEGGVRDANLDKGWLTQPPSHPQLHCPSCDKWHKTKQEITKCGKDRNAFILKYQRQARKEISGNEDEREQMKQDIADLKSMIAVLLARDKDNNE